MLFAFLIFVCAKEAAICCEFPYLFQPEYTAAHYYNFNPVCQAKHNSRKDILQKDFETERKMLVQQNDSEQKLLKQRILDLETRLKDQKITGNLNEKQQQAIQFIQKNVLDVYGSTGPQKILDTVVFDILKYIVIFPGSVNKLTDQHGNIMPDCFLLKEGSTALDFAFKLHTDIAKGFIRAKS